MARCTGRIEILFERADNRRNQKKNRTARIRQKKAELEKWLEELRMRFTRRILSLSEKTFLVWGKMYGEFERKGIVRPAFDSLLEASALEHDMIFVTRNVKNFRNSQVTIFNPWED